MASVFNRLKKYAELVMLSHSLFSLPFGLIAMVWAYGGSPPARVFFWIVAALFSARLGANAFNRVADRFIDAKNARTAGRHLPAGEVRLSEAAAICFVCLAGVCVSAYMLNPTCLVLLPFAAALIFGYSYTKRFTWLCHFILGAACGCAPVGAWIAVKGSPVLLVPLRMLFFGWLDITPLILGAAVCFYVAGFDIIYAVQDIEFDRREGLHSVPARFGAAKAMAIASASHFLSALLFFSLFFIEGRGALYLAASVLAAALLFVEDYSAFHVHVFSNEGRESRFLQIGLVKRFAEYGINRIVSIGFCVLALADWVL